MATLTIRNLDDALGERLRARAAEHGRSAEEEARHILRRTLCGEAEPEATLPALARDFFGPEHGVNLDRPERGAAPDPPRFET